MFLKIGGIAAKVKKQWREKKEGERQKGRRKRKRENDLKTIAIDSKLVLC
jgi:hypothetical protein